MQRNAVKDVYFLQVEKPLLYLTVLGGNSIWLAPSCNFVQGIRYTRFDVPRAPRTIGHFGDDFTGRMTQPTASQH